MDLQTFIFELEKLKIEQQLIKHQLDSVRFTGSLDNNPEYDSLKKRFSEKRLQIIKKYDELDNDYHHYINNVKTYEKYFSRDLENYEVDDDLFNELKRNIELFVNSYIKETQIDVSFSYLTIDLLEMSKGSSPCLAKLNKDVNNIAAYFKNKKDENIYKWEIGYLTSLLLNGHLTHSYPFDLKELERCEECNEYLDSYNKIISDLKNNRCLDFSLLVWTVFKTYHYFRNQSSTPLVDKADLILIDKLFEILFTSFDIKGGTVKENKNLVNQETYFLYELSRLLILDLIHTIGRNFPDYYFPCIMFLGYNLYTPAGCSDLDANMSSFDKYFNNIKDYDFWLNEDGEEIFKKLNVSNNYQEVLKSHDLK